MLITAKQDKLLRFPGLQDFAAVLRFESEQGNELLRDMENPAHDQFEPERLDEGRRRRGRRALNRVVSWVRRELRDTNGKEEPGEPGAKLPARHASANNGLGTDELPPAKHQRHAGEAHVRMLPRQPLVRQIAAQLLLRRL